MSANERKPVDGSDDGTIVNPGSHYEPDDSVGDDADEANDIRFTEEQQLIQQQVGHPEGKPAASE